MISGFSVFFVPTNSPNCLASGSPPSCFIPGILVKSPQQFFNLAPQIAGYFIQGSQIYLWLGLGVYITASIFFNVLRPSPRPLRVARSVVALFVLGLLFYPVNSLATVLLSGQGTTELIAIVMLALAINFSIAAYLYYYFNRRRKPTQIIEGMRKDL